MSEREFFHECRAAGIVFKTAKEWCDWLESNEYNVDKVMAEHHGFRWNANDVCLNPSVFGECSVDGEPGHGFRVLTARTQYGWLWGCDIKAGKRTCHDKVCYPGRYDRAAVFYDTEENAARDALSFVISQLGAMGTTRGIKILAWKATRMRADIVHPQMELFADEDGKGGAGT